MLDDNGIGNEKVDGIEAREYSIGIGIMLAGDDPIIGEIFPEQTIGEGETADIWAKNITTTGTINRVWAVITSPKGEMTTAQLIDDGTGTYESTFNDLNTFGEYNVVMYAEDFDGNISFPLSTTINYEEKPVSLPWLILLLGDN